MTEQEAIEANVKGQKDAAQAEFKRKAKFQALSYAPKSKSVSNGGLGGMVEHSQRIEMTAAEVKDASEILYQWLIKDL